jgi:hypothetical protein
MTHSSGVQCPLPVKPARSAIRFAAALRWLNEALRFLTLLSIFSASLGSCIEKYSSGLRSALALGPLTPQRLAMLLEFLSPDFSS